MLVLCAAAAPVAAQSGSATSSRVARADVYADSAIIAFPPGPVADLGCARSSPFPLRRFRWEAAASSSAGWRLIFVQIQLADSVIGDAALTGALAGAVPHTYFRSANPYGDAESPPLPATAAYEDGRVVLRLLGEAAVSELFTGGPADVWLKWCDESHGGRDSTAVAVTYHPGAMPADLTEAPERSSAETCERPCFTPYTTAPVLLNRAEVAEQLHRAYPPLLRDARIGGTTVVWIRIDTEGNASGIQLHSSSASVDLDMAALRVAEAMRFTPARNGERPVTVWVQMPITFRSWD